MPIIKRSAIVPYSAKEMYDLVNEVVLYPQFLPWCKSSDILMVTEEEIRARLHLSWMGLEKTFSTSNRLQPPKMIEISLLDGPFHYLQGFWQFTSITPLSCRVQFDLNFELHNVIIDKMLGTILAQIANNLVESFCKRAIQIYGMRANLSL